MHIGLVCPEVSGHLNPMTTLGRELVRRGHRVTLIGKLDGRARAESAGLGFVAIGASVFPLGAMDEFAAGLGRRRGLAAARYTLARFEEAARMMIAELPGVLAREGVEGLVVDQVTSDAAAVAEAVGLPFVTVANALALDEEAGVPPFITTWSYRDAGWARLRNRLGWWGVSRLARPIVGTVNAYRRAQGLVPWTTVESRFSPLAQIAQQPACFDFPRRHLSPTFHYTGPFHDARSGLSVDFPWDRLDGRPLVYASMGTLQNRLIPVFRAIAAACAPLDVQLVVSLGGAAADVPRDLAGSPIAVRFAPQLALLDRAALAITHAGLNTVLESLARGVPAVAIPGANDQPGVAARLRHVGAGEVLALRSLSPLRLRAAVRRVLEGPTYRAAATVIRDAIAASDGLARAGDIAERALTTGAPVLRGSSGSN